VRLTKRIERYGKRRLLGVLKGLFRTEPATLGDFDRAAVSKILVVRQDSRLGNLVLMTPLLAGLREAFPAARIDVLVAEGFHDVYRRCPFVDGLMVFEKRKARLFPWWYPAFVRRLRGIGYDLVVEVSNGHTFSFNNVLLTALTGARYRVGYDRHDAGSFLNLLAPAPPEDMHMADAMFGLVTFLAPGVRYHPIRYFLDDADREFADKWLAEQGFGPREPFVAIHPGGRGEKQWGAANFAALIDRVAGDLQIGVVCIHGPGEDGLVAHIREIAAVEVRILRDVTIGRMAAVIERCSLFISNDTGPMHVASALNRPTVGIFISSNFRRYGPRGKYGRSVVGSGKKPAVDDVMVAIIDMLEQNGDSAAADDDAESE